MLVRSVVLALFVIGLPAVVPNAAADDVTATVPSIERFVRVDERLYRGAQPDTSGFASLRDLGVRTIVSLREDAAEREIVEGLGMRFVHIPVTLRPFGMSGPVPDAAIRRFFEVMDDPESGVVFLHCRHGRDRTGTFVGLYRIARQRWSAEDAYREARDIGMRWWHFPVKRQLARFALGAPAPADAPVVRPAVASGM